MAWQLYSFEQDAALCEQLAARLADCLVAGIKANGEATLAVSGGSTPVPLFADLANADLDWAAVTITLVDERWLPPDHPDANARLIREHLLQGAAAAARFVPLYSEGCAAQEAQSEVDARLAALSWPLDAVVLGMGNDGHTASLFPGSASLDAALAGQDSEGNLSRCCAVTPRDAPYDRMTLTLPAILDSKALFLHIRGAEKRLVLEQALQPGPAADLPVRAVLHSDRTVHIFSSDD